MGKRFTEMTKEELAEAGRKGGLKSVEVRRKKKAMKEALETLLQLPLKDQELVEAEEVKSLAELSGKNIDIQKALKGSVASAEFLRDTAGERPEDIVNLNADGEDTKLNININYGTSDNKEQT